MQKNILINDSDNIYIKNNIKYILGLLKDDFRIHINTWRGGLFYAYQKINPDIVIWSTSSYDQEFHNFISEYGDSCKIILFEDAVVSQENLVPILNNIKNLHFVSNSNLWKNIICSLNKLYDDEIFMDFSKNRNGKYLALLSANNEKNKELLTDIIYPNNPDKKIVTIGNPDFDSMVNIGVVQYLDLPNLLNEFSYFIDIDAAYHLEATACGINIIDTEQNLQKAIDDNLCIKIPKESLSELTYRNFVAKNIVRFIKENI